MSNELESHPHVRLPQGTPDALGRALQDLRISVTDRCNLRCTYCMPADRYRDEHAFLSKTELLSFSEIVRVAAAATALGVRKLRITGGEPLLRRELPLLVEQLAHLDGIEDIALTTNGVLLEKHAYDLRAAGLTRVTVSLDSLDDEVLRRLNGEGAAAAPVLRGIDATIAAGFTPPKINVVVQRGVNEHTVIELAHHFRGTGCIPRFIEFMDVGTLNQWSREQVVTSSELLRLIGDEFPLSAVEPTYQGEVAKRYRYMDDLGEIGFISSVSRPFCGDCTRWRLSSDGLLYGCLFAQSGANVKALLRNGADDPEIHGWMRNLWRARRDRYSEERARTSSGTQAAKVEMYHVGG